MKKATALLLLLSVLLAGCGAKNDGKPPEMTETTAKALQEETLTEATKAIGDEEGTMSKQLTLMVDGTVIPVIWEDNPSVGELSEWASNEPIRIDMGMYGGWEQVGSLGHSLPRNDVQTTALPGDVMLYSGNQIVLFYGENSWAYTKLGHIDLTGDEVTNLLSRGAVSITLAVQ